MMVSKENLKGIEVLRKLDQQISPLSVEMLNIQYMDVLAEKNGAVMTPPFCANRCKL